MMPRIEKMFEQLDVDGSGDISLDEIESAPPELAEELAKCFQTDDLYELFEMLDGDRIGSVPIHQFCSELVKVVVSDRSVDQVRMQKTMVSLRTGVLDVRDQLEQMEIRHKSDIAAIQEDVAAIRAALVPGLPAPRSPPSPPAQARQVASTRFERLYANNEPLSPQSPTLNQRF
jgi:hypothetical protein